MTTSARRFLFGEDFREPRPADTRERDTEREAAHEQAIRDSYEAGRQAGRREAEAEMARQLADALGRLEGLLPAVLERSDKAAAEAEAECLHYFDTLARKLAGSALNDRPLAAVADAAVAAFRHLRGVPHLAVRVSAPLVEEAESLLRRLAREQGFEGRIIVLGDEDLLPGDARLDWGDGGVVRDRATFEAAIDRALALAKNSPANTSEAAVSAAGGHTT